MGLVDTLIGKAVEKIFDFLPNVIKKKSITFIESPQIDEIARDLVRKWLSIDCFFVLIAHNGKKKKVNHKYKFTSIVAGDFEQWILPLLKVTDFVYYEIDDHYRRMLEDIKDNEYVDVVATDDGTNSKIKRNIQYLGLQRVRYFFLKENEEKGILWYAVAGTKQPDEDFNSKDHKYHFEMAINKIKKALTKH